MVEIVAPRPDETVGDPACGTAGFLISAMEYLMETHTSPEAVIIDEDGSKTYTGDKPLIDKHQYGRSSDNILFPFQVVIKTETDGTRSKVTAAHYPSTKSYSFLPKQTCRIHSMSTGRLLILANRQD